MDIRISEFLPIVSAVTRLLFTANLIQAQSDKEESQQETQTVVSQDAEDSVDTAKQDEVFVELDPQRVTRTRLQGGDPSWWAQYLQS